MPTEVFDEGVASLYDLHGEIDTIRDKSSQIYYELLAHARGAEEDPISIEDAFGDPEEILVIAFEDAQDEWDSLTGADIQIGAVVDSSDKPVQCRIFEERVRAETHLHILWGQLKNNIENRQNPADYQHISEQAGLFQRALTQVMGSALCEGQQPGRFEELQDEINSIPREIGDDPSCDDFREAAIDVFTIARNNPEVAHHLKNQIGGAVSLIRTQANSAGCLPDEQSLVEVWIQTEPTVGAETAARQSINHVRDSFR